MSKVSKLIAVALVFAMMHVSARADLAVSAAGAQGRLVTGGDRNITVSGVNAKTGDTVFSGQALETPAGTGASVQVASLGRVDFAPNSAGTLTFGEGRLGVALSSGCVIVSSEQGVTGTVNAKGEPSSREGGSVDVCLSAKSDEAPLVDAGAAAGAGAGAAQGPPNPAPPPSATGGGLSNAAAIVLTVGGVVAFAVIANKLISDSENPGASGCTPGPVNPSSGLPGVCT